MKILLLLSAVIFIVLLVWLAAFIYLSDFSISSKDTKKFKSILVVFPHADDETLTASGLMRQAALEGAKVTWVVLTKGERGNPTDTLDSNLKSVRTKEAQKIAKNLHVTNLLQEDFGDGQIKNKKPEIKKFLTTIFEKEKPDLVITYDLSGWYGHPDHIVTSEVVTDLVKNTFKTTHLWYASLPKKVWALSGGLPTQMAETPDWIQHRTYPDVKVFIGANVIQTVQSVYLYKSQYHAWRSAIPFAPIPMWFFVSMDVFEYFHVVQ